MIYCSCKWIEQCGHYRVLDISDTARGAWLLLMERLERQPVIDLRQGAATRCIWALDMLRSEWVLIYSMAGLNSYVDESYHPMLFQ